MPSSSFLEYCIVQCTYRDMGKTFTHIKKNVLKKKNGKEFKSEWEGAIRCNQSLCLQILASLGSSGNQVKWPCLGSLPDEPGESFLLSTEVVAAQCSLGRRQLQSISHCNKIKLHLWPTTSVIVIRMVCVAASARSLVKVTCAPLTYPSRTPPTPNILQATVEGGAGTAASHL